MEVILHSHTPSGSTSFATRYRELTNIWFLHLPITEGAVIEKLATAHIAQHGTYDVTPFTRNHFASLGIDIARRPKRPGVQLWLWPAVWIVW